MLPTSSKEDVVMRVERLWARTVMYFGPAFFIIVIFACGVMMMYMTPGYRGKIALTRRRKL
jgi:hypothetical protein